MNRIDKMTADARFLIDRARRSVLRAQDVTEVQLRALYRNAAKKISHKIAMFDGDTTRLTRLLNDIESEIVRLNRRVTGAIETHLDWSVRTTLKADIDAGKGFDGMLSRVRVVPGKEAFDKIFHSAIRSLMTGTDGITLSDRVWRAHATTLEAMKRYMAQAYMQGLYPSQMVKELRHFLVFPDTDMRTRYWREFFKRHPPGRGVYRSAYKNVERVLRTESNRSYKLATGEYAQQMSWAEGLKWNRTVAEYDCPICEELESADYYGMGPGVYPATEFPDSPHPHCLCFFTIIPRKDIITKYGLEQAA